MSRVPETPKGVGSDGMRVGETDQQYPTINNVGGGEAGFRKDSQDTGSSEGGSDALLVSGWGGKRQTEKQRLEVLDPTAPDPGPCT